MSAADAELARADIVRERKTSEVSQNTLVKVGGYSNGR